MRRLVWKITGKDIIADLADDCTWTCSFRGFLPQLRIITSDVLETIGPADGDPRSRILQSAGERLKASQVIDDTPAGTTPDYVTP